MKRAALVLAAFVFGACAQPAPTTHPSATAEASAPPTSVATAAVLRVQGTVRESCGGGEGGCAYLAELAGDGWTHKAEFAYGRGGGAIVVDTGLPKTLPAGAYTLTLTSRYGSDVIVNVLPQVGGEDARCVAEFSVAAGQVVVNVRSTFDKGACSIDVEAHDR